MKFTVFTMAEAGIDKATAHNWMNCLALKQSARTCQMRVPITLRGVPTDTTMSIRYLPVQAVITIAEDMLNNGRTTTNKDKWRSILLIALKLRGVDNV